MVGEPLVVRSVCKTDNMEHPKDVGDRSTLAAMLALGAAGYEVLLPFGENTRYDLVIERDARFQRVQCKTGRYVGGAVRFPVASSYYHHPNPPSRSRSYVGHVDAFAVYCAATAGIYLIPIAELAHCARESALRVEPCRNNQSRRIRWAERYLVGSVALTTGGLRGPSGA